MQLLKFLWASPYTFLGMAIGWIGLCTGGEVRARGRTLEFYGGVTTWFVRHLPTGPYTLAMTLGHTILGQSGEMLDTARLHELVHVAQFERWGPFMGPAYLGASAWLWIRGKNAYRDNPFEREAYDVSGDEW